MARLVVFSLIVSGIRATFDTDLNPSTTPLGSGGFRFIGSPGSAAGDRASTAGDFNGDGLADMIFAETSFTVPARRVYVFFGRQGSASFDTVIDADFVAGDTTGFSVFNMECSVRYFQFSTAAASIGDFNMDGFDDIAVGNPCEMGVVYVIYGRQHSIKNIDVQSWVSSSTNGFRLFGDASFFGSQILNIGDFNGDGVRDFAVYAADSYADSCTTYVVFGYGSSHGTDINFSDLVPGSHGFRIYPTGATLLVPGACGDVNNDGIDDIAMYVNQDDDFGKVYILFGHTTATSFADLSPADMVSGTAGVLIIGVSQQYLGAPQFFDKTRPAGMGRGGDFNADGLQDLVLGGHGVVYVLFGRQEVPSYDDIDLSSWPDATNQGQKYYSASGYTFGPLSMIGSAGDFNDDGIDDIFMFSPEYNEFRSAPGFGAVMYGHDNSTPFDDISLDSFTTSTTGLHLFSSSRDYYFGFHAGNAGDVNGDGVPDLIFSEPYLTARERKESGQVYVLFGGSGSVGDTVDDDYFGKPIPDPPKDLKVYINMTLDNVIFSNYNSKVRHPKCVLAIKQAVVDSIGSAVTIDNIDQYYVAPVHNGRRRLRDGAVDTLPGNEYQRAASTAVQEHSEDHAGRSSVSLSSGFKKTPKRYIKPEMRIRLLGGKWSYYDIIEPLQLAVTNGQFQARLRSLSVTYGVSEVLQDAVITSLTVRDGSYDEDKPANDDTGSDGAGSSSSSALPLGAIVGIAVGGAAVVALIAAMACLCCKRAPSGSGDAPASASSRGPTGGAAAANDINAYFYSGVSQRATGGDTAGQQAVASSAAVESANLGSEPDGADLSLSKGGASAPPAYASAYEPERPVIVADRVWVEASSAAVVVQACDPHVTVSYQPAAAEPARWWTSAPIANRQRW